MEKKCPRCNAAFLCQNDNIMECDCIHVVISQEDYHYIRNNYNDCLCTKCLYEIKTERQRSPKLSAVPQ